MSSNTTTSSSVVTVVEKVYPPAVTAADMELGNIEVSGGLAPKFSYGEFR